MINAHIDTGRNDRTGETFCGRKQEAEFTFATASFYLSKFPKNLDTPATCAGCRKGFLFAKS